MARLAKCLVELRHQVDIALPNRDRKNDGWIGDARHQASVSDHNPDSRGIVHAIDISHDPAHGFNSYTFADFLLKQKDPRIKYIISNRRIAGGHQGVQPWEWRRYTGTYPHDEHVHISVLGTPLEDQETPWVIPMGPQVEMVATDVPPPIPQHPVTIPRQENIVCSFFGGTSDNERSAYDGHVIGGKELGCALPWNFIGTRPQVRASANGHIIIFPIIDKGPWYVDDGYWATSGTRPRAEQYDIIESGPNRGKKSNHAGIDLTPALFQAFGFSLAAGIGKLDWWEFVGTDVVKPPPVADTSVVMLQRMLGFSKVEQDGDFGELTERAVIWFQRRSGLTPDGIVGPLTWTALQQGDRTYV